MFHYVSCAFGSAFGSAVVVVFGVGVGVGGCRCVGVGAGLLSDVGSWLAYKEGQPKIENDRERHYIPTKLFKISSRSIQIGNRQVAGGFLIDWYT